MKPEVLLLSVIHSDHLVVVDADHADDDQLNNGNGFLDLLLERSFLALIWEEFQFRT